MQLKGALFVALSAFFFGSYGVWARLSGAEIPTLYQVWMRCFVALAILVPAGIISKSFKHPKKKDLKNIAIYTLAGALTFTPYFYAFNHLGIGSATLLFYASFTITSYVLGIVFFREKMTLAKIASLLLALIGLGLIFNFSWQHNAVFAAFMGILAGSAGGVEVVFTKNVSHTYSPIQVSTMLWGVSFIIHLLLSLATLEPITVPTMSIPWLGVLGYGLASLAAFYLVSLGYKYIEPSVGGVVGLLEIIVGIAFGVLLFSEVITFSIGIGAIFILVSAALPNIAALKAKM